jgi:hypothetical protein
MNDFIQFESEKILDMECVMWLFLFYFIFFLTSEKNYEKKRTKQYNKCIKKNRPRRLMNDHQTIDERQDV